VDDFVGLISSTRRVSLDESHNTLIKWLETNNKSWWWDSEHWMLVCHTAALKEAHNELNCRGLFDTIAEGKDEGDQNCFAFPLYSGAWVVRRHTRSTAEHKLWFQDRSGWTCCYFNRYPYLDTVLSMDGIETSNGAYNFKQLGNIHQVLKVYGITDNISEFFNQRRAIAKKLGGSKLLVGVERIDGDPIPEGWYAGKKHWECIYSVPEPPLETFPADHVVRNVVANGKDAGWFVYSRDQWVAQPKTNMSDVLIAQGIKRGLVSSILGESVLQHWRLANLPFQPEYPGNRQWNKFAAQFSVEPKQGDHSTWDLILDHIGRGLLVNENAWCQDNGITQGAEYLKLWIAALLQYPLEPLPYLFLYNPAQDTGKSTLHEAIRLLFKDGFGVARADTSLVNQGHFNGELEGAVLCVVEEINLRTSKTAYDKVKDWVTGKTISIHIKGRTPYDTVNTTHWIQCANNPSYCPIFPGDSRIVVISVERPVNIIPKKILFDKLINETPAFLYSLLSIEIPESEDRLRLPVISTSEKEVQEELNETLIETFVKNYCWPVNGHMILFEEFCQKIQTIMTPQDAVYWTPRRIAFALPPNIIRGKVGEWNKTALGNLSWDRDVKPDGKYIRIKDRLKRVPNDIVTVH
jgi:hypothetical protein